MDKRAASLSLSVSMSAISFQEALKAKRHAHLEALSRIEDGEALKHARTKGVMQGLDEAAAMFAEHLKADFEGDKT